MPNRGIWITQAEIEARPMTGPEWAAMKSAADRAIGTPDLSNQEDTTNVLVLAKALVYARTGNNLYRDQVVQACMAAIGTEAGGRTLAFARELPAYVIAADVVGLSAADHTRFSAWLRMALTENLDGKTLISTQEERPNNWGTHASAACAAIGAYLNDETELVRCSTVFKGWLGDRSMYAGFKFGDLDWQADPSKPVGVNAVGTTIQGHPVDGCLPDDQRRAGGFTWPPQKENYVWEGLQGANVAAEILHRAGYDAWEWESKALLRAASWVTFQAQLPAEGDDQWQTSLLNHRYGSAFAVGDPGSMGKNMAWTAWTHGGVVVEPPVPQPLTITSFTPATGWFGDYVAIRGTGFLGVDQVTIGGLNATFAIVTAGDIQAVVPAGADSGPVVVRDGTVSATSSITFTVTPPVEPPTDGTAAAIVALDARLDHVERKLNLIHDATS